MNKMASVLVTGCAGFIGYHLSVSLLKDGVEVLGIDNLNEYYDINLKNNRLSNLQVYNNFTFQKVDIADKDSLSQKFKQFQPDMVVNLAAQAGVRYSIKNPYAYLDSNLTGFLNILEMCRHHEIGGLVYASSSSVYGSNTKYPFSTSDRTDNPIALYGATKKANELMAHSYSHLYDLPTTGLRYFTVYGPWGRPDMAMYIFTEKICNGDPIPVFNKGNMKRDFTFIDDIISCSPY
jgi:UDP-glucuronate 4-epimerase